MAVVMVTLLARKKLVDIKLQYPPSSSKTEMSKKSLFFLQLGIHKHPTGENRGDCYSINKCKGWFSLR